MKLELLQSEFLRLSDQYPEIRHAVASGDQNWRSVRPPSDDTRIFGDGPIKVLSDHGLNEDNFARVYCLWIGDQDQQREYSAENEFHRLAQIAAECVPLKSLKSRGGPVQGHCVLTVDTKTPAPKDSLEVGTPQVRIPRVNKWVSHVIVANGVIPRPCKAISNRVIGHCHIRVLTIDSFRASAFALGSPATDHENDPPKGKPAAAGEGGEEGVSGGAVTDPIHYDDIVILTRFEKKTVQNWTSKWRKTCAGIANPCSYAVVRPFLLKTWADKAIMFPADYSELQRILATQRTDSP